MVWWFVETSLVAGALAGVASLASRLRPLGPAARHALWLVVMLKLVTPPMVHAPWAFTRPVSAATAVAALPGTSEGDGPAVRDRDRVAAVNWSCVPRPADAEPDCDGESAGTVCPVWGLGPGKDAGVVDAASVRVWVHEVDVPVGTPGETDGPAAAPAVPADLPDRSVAAPPPDGLAAPEAILAGMLAPLLEALGPWVVGAWGLVSLLLAAGQGWRVVRFARRLRDAAPAPGWVVEGVGAMADRLGVRAPEALAVPGIGVPMLWCLGRPKLLLPAHLLKTLKGDRWRGVLAHELAHLRRGDPWVARLTLLAGLAWWWNPVYWLARRRIDAEAELACDAWVVWALPADRVVYASTMLDICESLSSRPAPMGLPPLAPALGVSGAGRFFERRLTMILSDRVPCRLSLPGLIGPGLLVLMGLPSWTAAAPSVDDPPVANVEKAVTVNVSTAAVANAEKTATVTASAAADDDDDEAEAKSKARAKAGADRAKAVQERAKAVEGRAKAALERAEQQLRRAEGRAGSQANEQTRAHLERLRDHLKQAAEAEAKASKEAGGDPKARTRVRVLMEKKDDREKDGKILQEDVSKDGPYIIRREVRLRRAENDGDNDRDKAKAKAKAKGDIDIEIDDLAKAFSPDSDLMKALKTLGPELQKKLQGKFGPGSDFDAKAKELGEKIGKELQEKLGPGSDFDKAMKQFAKELQEQLGPGSDFEKKMKEFGSDFEKQRKETGEAPTTRRREFRVEIKPRDDQNKDKAGDEAKARAKIKERATERLTRDRKAAAKSRSERRAQLLEAQIKALSRELERLKAEAAKAGDKDEEEGEDKRETVPF